MSLAITNTSPRISRLVARLQAQSSYWLAWVLLVMHMNVNTVDVGYHVKGCAFHLVGCYLNTLMFQLMAGAERLCHCFEWGRELMSYFQMGSRDEKGWEPLLDVPGRIGEASPAGCTHGKTAQRSPCNQVEEWLTLWLCFVPSWNGTSRTIAECRLLTVRYFESC